VPTVHFTAPINAFSASSDGQQQRSTPLFGSGISSMLISTGQLVIGAPMSRSLPMLSLTVTDGKKDLGLCRLRAKRVGRECLSGAIRRVCSRHS